MKKLAMSLLLAILSFGVSVNPAGAVLHATGSSIIASNGTVYTITKENNQLVKRPYTSAGAFLSYSYNTWESVSGASTEDMALPTGSFIPPQDGKVVCSDRGADKGTCYLITLGKRAGFTSRDVFTGLGYNFAYALYGDVSFLPYEENISSNVEQHKPGALVNKDGTIYLVSNTGLLGLPDWKTLESWGYKTTDIVLANSADRALAVHGVLVPKQPDQIAPPTAQATSLIVSDPFVSFNVAAGSTTFQNYSAHISNSSDKETINYNISVPNQPAWLNSGYATQTLPLNPLGTAGIGVGINPTGLGVGTYVYTINLTGNFVNSPASIKVTLIVGSGSTTPTPTPTPPPGSTALQITTSSLPETTVGQAYTAQLQASGGTAPYSWSYTNTTYPSACCILGFGSDGKFTTQTNSVIADHPGTFTWDVVVTDAAGHKAYRAVSLTIKALAAPVITTSALPNATIGQPYSAKLEATGGKAPYTWSPLDSTYPFGCCVLGIGTDGTFNTQTSSNVFGPAGTFTWNAQVTDANGAKSTKIITLTILAGTNATFNFVTATPLPEAKVGVAYSQKVTFYYNTSGTNYATNGTATGLPPGIGPASNMGMLPGIEGPGKASYTLLGTPTQAGTYNVQMYLTDQYGASQNNTYTLVVNP